MRWKKAVAKVILVNRWAPHKLGKASKSPGRKPMMQKTSSARSGYVKAQSVGMFARVGSGSRKNSLGNKAKALMGTGTDERKKSQIFVA
jgi:hypothetical protein